HGLVKKKGPQIESLDINDAILEAIGLTRSEVTKNDVANRRLRLSFLADFCTGVFSSMKEASRSKAIEVAAIPASALDRRGKPHGPFRRLLRGFIHFFSYHVILSRRGVRTIPAAGFRLSVPPTVFHPRFFLSSEYFAEFIDRLDLSGKSVADIGTG